MNFLKYFLAFLFVAFAGHARAEITMNYCSITCSDNSVHSSGRGEGMNLLAGPPGKRGSPGPPGRPGVRGTKGGRGEPGDCTHVENELELLKNTVNNLKRVSLIGWVKASNDRWYRLVREKVTFARARELCRTIGANLASTGMRNDTVRSEVVSMLEFKPSEWIWIGLSDIENEGTWVWDDGSQEAVTNWARNEPSDNGGTTEDCGHFYNNFKYNDVPCSSNMHYLCETDTI